MAEFAGITADRPREAETPDTDPWTDHIGTFEPSPPTGPAGGGSRCTRRPWSCQSRENSSDRVGQDRRRPRIAPQGLGKCPGPPHTWDGAPEPTASPASTAGRLRQPQPVEYPTRVAVADEGSAFTPSARLCLHLPAHLGSAGGHLREPMLWFSLTPPEQGKPCVTHASCGNRCGDGR